LANPILAEYLQFSGTITGTSFDIEFGSANFLGNLPVVDNDTSGTMSTGDYLSTPQVPYAGFTATINGNVYAVFEDTVVAGTYYIPHQGELTPSDLPDPFNISFQPDVTVVNCFIEGTCIATVEGALRVEDLRPGDRLRLADGGTAPVRWVGRQTVSTRFGAADRLMPVRIRAGALGDGLPLRDLVLTADHALLLDGFLVNAGALVNGSGIDWMPLAELGGGYTVYHIETETHDIILAEGAPAETFIDYVGRQAFDNYAEYVALYGADRDIVESPAPRITAARHLPAAIRARLGIARAA